MRRRYGSYRSSGPNVTAWILGGLGHTYRCTKFGWRVPLFSMFENIRDCEPVS